MKLFVAAVIAVLISSCSTLSHSGSSEVVLFNPVINAGALAVSVMSNGCTKPEHFYLIVNGERVELRRTDEDLCRAAPQLVRFEFEYDFGDDAYRFKNDVRYANRVVR